MVQERQEGKSSRFTGITVEELQKVADGSEQVCAIVHLTQSLFQTFTYNFKLIDSG